jgi:hypothetical protein
MSRRDLETFFLGTGCLAIGRSLPFVKNNPIAEVAFGKPLSNLHAEAQKVNPGGLSGGAYTGEFWA